MADLKSILTYILRNYPSNLAHELSNARLTKIIYLSDWKNCLTAGHQMSNINWYFDNHGPFVHDVLETVRHNPKIFEVNETENMYGGKKRVIGTRKSSFEPSLTTVEMSSIDSIIEITRKMYWDEFIKLVYGTYPITTSERYSSLDLVAKAKAYKKNK